MGFLPTNYRPVSNDSQSAADENRKSRYFETKNLKDGESTTFRLCGIHDTGHVIAGWQYFTADGRPRRFPSFPENYLDDIGLTWEGKKNGTGEKAKPVYFLSFVGLSREADDFLIFTIKQRALRNQLEETLAIPDYQFLPSGLANFYLSLKRHGEGTDTSWTLLPTLKKPTAIEEERWTTAARTIWLPALFVNGDPFAGKPAQAVPAGLPPTHRDALGADIEIATAQPAEPGAMPAGW